ncbi:MAG TPA: tetratricopeptide repeat protein [Rhodothermales bacterium]|nr:tetratricopeptide repeat protein [Rhodothermales bacterium]
MRRGFLVLLGGLLLLVGCQQPEEPAPIVDPATRQLVATANQAMENEEYDRALALADSAARRAPKAVEPIFLKGLIYSRTLRWDEAEEAYRRAIKLDPDFPGVWNNMGNNAVWRGAYQEAISYYYNEVEVAPAPMPWSGIGRIYRELGVIDSAAYAFEQAIALDSSHIPAYLSYAQLLEDEGEYERALVLTEQAAMRKPEAVEVKYMLGSLLARMEREEEAVSYLEAVTQAWPWHTESHYKLGQLLQRIGREEESRQVLAEAEELWKRQADITTYQKGLTTDPENPYAHAALATAFRMAGRYEEAIHTYKVAISLDPRNLEFQNNLASLYFLQKDTVAAIQTYRHILEQDPKMVEVWVNMGILYALSGEEAAARQAWQRALTYRPADPTIQGYLAKLDAAP